MGLRNRKQFLTTVGATGAALALTQGARASAADPSPVPSPPPPSPAATEKPISAAARATAATMRRFDPKLSDAEIERIARDIDDGASAGEALNPKKKRLRNGDEPVTTFAVPSE